MLSRYPAYCLTAVIALALLFLAPARAHHNESRYSVTLENRWGDVLPAYHHDGKIFVLGHYGDRYNIRIRNHTGRRVEAVVSVDGRDVVSGNVADYVRHRGYILEPHGSVLIEGFRQSLSRVASFRFTNPSDSYSSRRGTPQHVGVVGVAFFPEKRYRRRVPLVARERSPYRGRDANATRSSSEGAKARRAPAAGASTRDRAPAEAESSVSDMNERSAYYPSPRRRSRHNLGTRYGESRRSPAREVRFRRANSRHPDRILQLYYDDRDGLLARGIDLYDWPPPRPLAEHHPRPFPRNRFAPPPP